MHYDEETAIRLKVDPVFQIMYDIGTGVHLSSDASFRFIRLHYDPAVWNGSQLE